MAVSNIEVAQPQAEAKSSLPTLVLRPKNTNDSKKTRVILDAPNDLTFIRKIVNSKGVSLGMTVNSTTGTVTLYPLKGGNNGRLAELDSYLSS